MKCGANIVSVALHITNIPGDPWPEEWFDEHEVTMPAGETTEMRLCEMGSLVGSDKKMWMREVGKLTDSGHQTSVTSTAHALDLTHLSGRMFSRWCQQPVVSGKLLPIHDATL